GVVAVVPAIRNRGIGAQVGIPRKDVLGQLGVRIPVEVALQQPGVYLPSEPDEALHGVHLFIRLRRLVLHAVVDVVDRRFRAPAVGDLRPAGQRHVRTVVRVAGIHAGLVHPAERQPYVVAGAAARHRDVHVDVGAGPPEIPHVVGVRGPRPDAEELAAGLGVVVGGPGGVVHAAGGPAVKLGTPALVGLVVPAAGVAVDEVELAVEALPVLVLVV